MSYRRKYSEQEQYGLRDMLGMVRRQRWVIAACLLLGGVVGGWAAAVQRQQYEGSTVIRVDEKGLGLPTLDARIPFLTGNQVGAELQVLSSRTLAGGAVDALNLQVVIVSPRDLARSRVFSRIAADSAAPAGSYVLRSRRGEVEVRDA